MSPALYRLQLAFLCILLLTLPYDCLVVAIVDRKDDFDCIASASSATLRVRLAGTHAMAILSLAIRAHTYRLLS